MSYIPPIAVKSSEVKGIIAATFPSYRRREVRIQPRESVTLHNLNWSGGTRAEYKACTITGEPLRARNDMNAPAPWDNPFEGKTVPIPPGVVIVEGGYFCGKVGLLYIHCHPSDMPRYLPAAIF